jgi:purine-binding chemotaxis protein CheW
MSDFVSIRLAGQDFGVPVMQVRDILRRQRMTPVPLAPHAVAGLLHLRGRIVTAIDLRRRLGMPPAEAIESINVVVEHGGELYALIVDSVGDIFRAEQHTLERVPATLDPACRDVAAAVAATATGPIVLLDISRLLELGPRRRTAS